MRIAFSFLSLDSNTGIPTVIASFANAFAQKGDEVTILCHRSGRTDLDPAVAVRTIPLPRRGIHRLLRTSLLRPVVDRAFASVLREARPAIVNVHYPPFDAPILRLRDRFGYRTVYHYHSVTDPSLYVGAERRRRERERALLLSAIPRADAAVAISGYLSERLHEEIGISSTPVLHGVDESVYRPRPCVTAAGRAIEHPALLHVGRVVPHKGVQHLLGAFEIIRASRPDVHLYIVGRSEENEYCETIRRRADRIGAIHILGERPIEETVDYMNAADLFVCGSLYEGFGMPFLETQACGTPAIGFDICGLSEVIVQQETGVLVEPGDEKALAGAVLELLSDEEALRAMSSAALLHSKRFRWERSAEKLRRIYTALLS